MRQRMLYVLGVALFLLGTSASQAQEVFTPDPVHSTVGFKVRHLGVSFVSGKFDKFDGELVFLDGQLSRIEGTIDAASINTANEKRDGHLKSDDFFSTDKFPAMRFQSTKITQTQNTISIVGNLTIRDVTKIVVLQGEISGFVNMGDVRKTGLVLEGEINRKDFGLSFGKMLETGQAVVGDQVKLTIEIEADQKPQAPAMPQESKSETKAEPKN